MPQVVSEDTMIRLFADDCLAYRMIRTAQDQIALQNDLDSAQTSNQIHSPITKNHKCESCEESFVSQKELAVHVIGVHL